MKYPKGIRPRGNSLLVDVTVHGVRRTGTVAGLDVDKALALQAQIRADMLKNIVGERAKAGVWTLKQAFDKTCELHWNETESKAYENLQANAQRALNYFGEATPVDALTSDRLDEYAKCLKDEGLSGSTINRKMSAVSKMLTVAVRKKKLEVRPHIDRKKETPGRIRFLTPEEEASVLGVFEMWAMDEQRQVTIMLVDTGVRPSELWQMENRDLDFLNGLIHVWETKNDSPRSVPMTDRVRDILWKRSDVFPRGPLFPYDNYWYDRVWNRMKAHLKLDEDTEFVPYALRHTCASRLAQSGEMQLQDIQKWMGHKSITTTLRYAHLMPSNLQKGTKALAKFTVGGDSSSRP
ncbi:MAG: hypothetical protein A4E20_01530 [Nitrospira sp. SG-bin2]|uniref:tyrosine-type recombinase/integrase n=1 Tax=Nitrospira cf. moscoviensis SBR1015 TaxID=96242 RepID=UPI000A0B549F|nr:site-specific integrase [Nitrospira cf. moscoviensis SBR1015]OQW34886.1 MAG: hypothetical protein A4E20_01530 [Nitrospira sp. SG-bin2]